MIRFSFAFVSPALLLASCGSATDTETAVPSTTAADDTAAATSSMAPDAMGLGDAALPLTGQAFVSAMAASDQFEIESARIVQSAGVTGNVRDFAQMMIRDHQTSTDNLRKATSATDNVSLDETPRMEPPQEAMLAELRQAGTENVAQVYARQQVQAHEMALAKLKTYAQSGDAKPLMDFAAKTADVVAQHLEHARKLP